MIAGCGYPQSQRERTSLAIASFGAVGAARTEDGLGSGWALRAGAALGAGSCTEFHFGLRYERIEYADDTAFAVVAEMAPVTWWDADSPWGVVGHLGWAYRWTEAGNRGTGPSIGAGLFVRLSRGLLLSPYASACLSFGSREDEFDVDFEASASVDVALVF